MPRTRGNRGWRADSRYGLAGWLLLVLLLSRGPACTPRGDQGRIDTGEPQGGGSREGKVLEGTIGSPGGNGAESGRANLGYRVQVVASTLREEAEGVVEMMKGLVRDSVYIDYVDPFYKVRVGDFTTRREAEEMQERVAGLGFTDAWIVVMPIRADAGKP